MRKRDFLCREVFVCLSVIVFASLLFFVPSKEVTASPKDKAIKTRFVFSDLTALDKETGYMWTRDANIAKKGMNWNDALELIGKLNKQKYAGYNDWRLPSEEEIETLVDFAEGRKKGHINIRHTKSLYEYFNEIGFKNVLFFYYWSSTTSAYDTTFAWVVSVDGHVLYGNKTNNYCRVWPVRSGQ